MDSESNMEQKRALSQFLFEAIWGMLSLHDQWGIMRESDNGD
jgi:hypothetical protein